MNAHTWIELGFYLAALFGLGWPLGRYMARVFSDEPQPIRRWLEPLERLLYRLCGIDAGREMSAAQYAVACLAFSLLGTLAVYSLMRVQTWLPLNPRDMPNATPDLAFNTASSFATNTNWQAYGGETTLSYLTQMAGLGVQNFLSAATGMAVLVALARGLARRGAETIGNFWVDLTRGVLYILLPLSLLLAIALVSQGVVQSFAAGPDVSLAEATKDADRNPVTTQSLPLGPAASQIAIKQLGTNGGGFFNVNSAHPFENPTPLSDFLQVLSILLIPAALCVTFGELVGDRRQGLAILAAMTLIFVPLLIACTAAEQSGNPLLAEAGAAPGGGNMEGKEVRFGVGGSARWAAATTAASNGSVNSMHDSFTPLGGLVPLWLMQLGEVVFGGVGSGLYGMVMFVFAAVFVAGLMVGRAPEYLGKKIEAFEIKMAALVILIPPALVLIGTAIALSTSAGKSAIYNDGAHGYSEVLYALSSAGNNNGSAFGGLGANNPFYNTLLGVVMLVARFWLIAPVLAIAGSLAKKKIAPKSDGSLPTHTPLFVAMLIGVVLLVGALTFLPALALGPIVEHLQMIGR